MRGHPITREMLESGIDKSNAELARELNVTAIAINRARKKYGMATNTNRRARAEHVETEHVETEHVETEHQDNEHTDRKDAAAIAFRKPRAIEPKPPVQPVPAREPQPIVPAQPEPPRAGPNAEDYGCLGLPMLALRLRALAAQYRMLAEGGASGEFDAFSQVYKSPMLLGGVVPDSPSSRSATVWIPCAPSVAIVRCALYDFAWCTSSSTIKSYCTDFACASINGSDMSEYEYSANL